MKEGDRVFNKMLEKEGVITSWPLIPPTCMVDYNDGRGSIVASKDFLELKNKGKQKLSREQKRFQAEAAGELPSYGNDFKGREWKPEYAEPGAIDKWIPILLLITRVRICSGNTEQTSSEIGVPVKYITRGESSHGAKFDLYIKDSLVLSSMPKELGIWVNPNQEGLKYNEIGIGSRGLAEMLLRKGLVPETVAVLQ